MEYDIIRDQAISPDHRILILGLSMPAELMVGYDSYRELSGVDHYSGQAREGIEALLLEYAPIFETLERGITKADRIPSRVKRYIRAISSDLPQDIRLCAFSRLKEESIKDTGGLIRKKVLQSVLSYTSGREPDAKVRTAACEFIGDLEVQEGLSAVWNAMLHDPDETVRATAVIATSKLIGEVYWTVLLSVILTDPVRRVRRAAFAGLRYYATRFPQTKASIREGLKQISFHENTDVLKEIAEFLAAF